MTTNKVSFLCNCGKEIMLDVKGEDEYEVVCPKCGQDYRFSGASVLRWSQPSGSEQ